MRAQLAQRIRDFIAHPSDFESLALDIHAWQVDNDPVRRALTTGPVTDIHGIPAVPVGLFRDTHVGTVRPDEPHVAFHTSGTSVGTPGVHRMRTTELYDRGCMAHAQRWLPKTRRTLALMPDNPHSSLAHMVRGFAPRTGPVEFLVKDDRLLDVQTPEPTFVCTTAFALDAWIATDPEPLPPGSAIMVTGGFKGRDHTLDAATLEARASALAPVLLEYGMTELSSQMWAHRGERFEPPPWMRILAVDPESGSPKPPGEAGQLRFVDLCNLDSTVAIETLDHGIVHSDGTLTLFGRLPDAPLRGCSLSVEDLLE